MNKQPMVLGAVAVLLVGSSFYGGTIYAKSSSRGMGQNLMRGQGAQAGQFAMRGGMGATRTMTGGFAAGKILSSDDKSITVELSTPNAAGSGENAGSGSKIVFISGDMKVYKTQEGSKDDLTNGTNVIVTGTPNNDGSLTAQSIQIRPEGAVFPMMGGFGGGRGGNTGMPSPTPTP